jgi:CubicO group peptidase (beta-lactamase class C family)
MRMQTDLIKDFVSGVGERQLAVRGIIVRQHGRILDGHDFFEPVERIQLYSASKSWTAMGVGIAISEGYFKQSDRMVDLLKGMLPEKLPENFDRLTVWHLLTMSTGHSECPIFKMQRLRREQMMKENGGNPPTPPGPPPGGPRSGNQRAGNMSDGWFDAFMNEPLTYDPDAKYFAYNNAASYLLSIIVQQTTGMVLRDFLIPRVFAPLGIENPEWDTDAKGHSLGAIGLHLTTEELSRGGQLLLNRGEWNGAQLIPAAYVDQMTAKQVSNDHNGEDLEGRQGYGFQIWRCTYPQAYRMDGMFGQFSIGLPTLDAVVAITSQEQRRTYDIIRLVWDTVTPKLETTL